MYIIGFALIQQSKDPLNQTFIYEEFNSGLFNTHFLQNCYTESLGNRAIFLFLQDLNNFLSYNQIYLCEIINTLDCACYDTNQSTYGMFKPVRVNSEEVHNKAIVFVLSYQEHIILNKFRD